MDTLEYNSYLVSDMMVSNAILSNTSFVSNYTHSTNDSAVCHPFLLKLGFQSMNGLCDDFISSRIVSSVIILIHSILFFSTFIALIYKVRKLRKDHVQVNFLTLARSPTLMFVSLALNYTYDLVIMGRILIGRKIFPCFIYSLFYYLGTPILAGTIILRLIRMIVLSRMNQLKVKIGTSCQKVGEQLIQRIQSGKNLKAELKKEETNQETKVEETSQIRIETKSSKSSKSWTNLRKSGMGKTMIKIETHNKPNLEQGKIIKMYKFITGSIFVVSFYIFILIAHLLLYLAVAIYDYFNYMKHVDDPTDSISERRQTFVINTFLFSTSGCGNGTLNTYIYLSMLAFYVIICVGLSIFAIFIKKDEWKVKKEVFLIITNWIVIVLVYGIPTFFYEISTLVDYFFPWVIIVHIGGMIDNFIACSIPIFYQKLAKKEPVDQISPVKLILQNKKWNQLFLKYSQTSYCPEDVMFWNAAEEFKRVKRLYPFNTENLEMFSNIVETFLTVGSPLELNMPRTENDVPLIFEIYDHLQSPHRRFTLPVISEIVFDKLQNCCEHNMWDIYLRFQQVYKESISEIVGTVEKV